MFFFLQGQIQLSPSHRSMLFRPMRKRVLLRTCSSTSDSLGRFQAGAAGMDIDALPFLTWATGVNLVNDPYCWLYFHAFALGQKMSWLLPSKGNPLDHIFERLVINEDGLQARSTCSATKRWRDGTFTSSLPSSRARPRLPQRERYSFSERRCTASWMARKAGRIGELS